MLKKLALIGLLGVAATVMTTQEAVAKYKFGDGTRFVVGVLKDTIESAVNKTSKVLSKAVGKEDAEIWNDMVAKKEASETRMSEIRVRLKPYEKTMAKFEKDAKDESVWKSKKGKKYNALVPTYNRMVDHYNELAQVLVALDKSLGEFQSEFIKEKKNKGKIARVVSNFTSHNEHSKAMINEMTSYADEFDIQQKKDVVVTGKLEASVDKMDKIKSYYNKDPKTVTIVD